MYIDSIAPNLTKWPVWVNLTNIITRSSGEAKNAKYTGNWSFWAVRTWQLRVCLFSLRTSLSLQSGIPKYHLSFSAREKLAKNWSLWAGHHHSQDDHRHGHNHGHHHGHHQPRLLPGVKAGHGRCQLIKPDIGSCTHTTAGLSLFCFSIWTPFKFLK